MSGQTVFKGLIGLDDWIWWIIVGGVALLLLVLILCFCVCLRRARAKGRREAEEAMREQRETEARERMLAEAQYQRQQRETQQRIQDEQLQQKMSMQMNGNWQQPSTYNAATYSRTTEPNNGLFRAPSAGLHGFVLPAEESPYSSMRSPHNTRQDSYASVDRGVNNVSMMSGDIAYSVNGTYLTDRTRDDMYSHGEKPRRSSDNSDFELDVDDDSTPAQRIPSHRSIEF
ncbi:hypothetical protein THRCLA_08925 [Thraustotheca clavata]|uniref:Uncharacterized protein n=1 Tax=Thraustotheca clavata TaxID=74557 RepID=A0A1V9Z0V1_9STRA|nr:hypothetical protein THRCLA_08925 [Thraustotheca clavata]